MPTKKRREKESERKLKDEAFGPVPGHLSDADMSLNKAAVSGWWGTNFVKNDENGEPYLHEKIGKGDNAAVGDNVVTMYADTGNIIKSGNVFRMWTLTDSMSTFTTTSGERFRSMKLQQEYDCKKGLARPLYISAHSANMGEGKVVFSKSSNEKWHPIPPDRKTLINFACGM